MVAFIAWASTRPVQMRQVRKNVEPVHAIQMRTPVQLPADVHEGDWWKAVWHFLIDRGLTLDVTPNRNRTAV